MNKKQNVTVFTLWVNRFIAVAVVVLIFTLELVLDWYCALRSLLSQERLALTVAFYCCAAVILYALWHMNGLLGSILKGLVFVKENVLRIRRVQWCCGLVSLICLPASFAYMPLLFVVVIMAFLCLCVSVVACVMDAAVVIREENDLTI